MEEVICITQPFLKVVPSSDDPDWIRGQLESARESSDSSSYWSPVERLIAQLLSDAVPSQNIQLAGATPSELACGTQLSCLEHPVVYNRVI